MYLFANGVHDLWNKLPGSVVDSEFIAFFLKKRQSIVNVFVRLWNFPLSWHALFPSDFIELHFCNHALFI
jgi:hypothetical protein